VNAVKVVQDTFPHEKNYLAGFSLGGNFALRVAVRAPATGIRLNHVMGVCPVLYPPHTMVAMESGLFIYHHYFMKKWRDSLQIKRKFFPHQKQLQRISGFKTIGKMTEYFVKNFTEYSDLMIYLKGYAITGDALKPLNIPSTILASLDDPIIPAKDLKHLAKPDSLTIETTLYGGHCGYLNDYRLTSWADRRMVDIFRSSV